MAIQAHCAPRRKGQSLTKTRHKIAESVLVVIHAGPQHVLLLRRADWGNWQSVTGSKDSLAEPWASTAAREVFEETGLDVHAPGARLQDAAWHHHYAIYPSFIHRYAPGVSHNTERVFYLRLSAPQPVRLSPREHTDSCWLPWPEAAAQVFSASNAWAIERCFSEAQDA
jgi:dATP pyrophosphohydrolase